jgi:ribosomal protein S3
VFYAELNELLTRELAEDGYSGVEVRVTPMRTEIIIRATRTQNVLGEQLDGASETCAAATSCRTISMTAVAAANLRY